MTTAPTPAWRKSSRSDAQDTCVELHRELDAVRDSKNIGGPVLRADVTALVNQIKAGRFDA
jgi:hypothetical protein